MPSSSRAARLLAPAPAAAPAAALLGLVFLVLVLFLFVVLVLVFVVVRLGLLGEARLLLGARRLGGFELGRDERVVLGAQVDLVVEVGAGRGAVGSAVGVAVRDEVVLLLERLDLLNGDLELMGYPGVGTTLADPAPDLVEVRSQ